MIGRTWIWFVAARYFSAARRTGRLASSALMSLGIAVGATALITVLAVMNGFQAGMIEPILAIDSHHLRLTISAGASRIERALSIADDAARIPGVVSALPFSDVRTVAYGRSNAVAPVLLKAVSLDAQNRDPIFFNRLGLRSGQFPSDGKGVVIGTELSRSLGATLGDTIRVLVIGASTEEGVSADTATLTVTGIFRSGYYDFDSSLCVVTFSAMNAMAGEGAPIVGVKLSDRSSKPEALFALAQERDCKVVDWREYNRSFFGALQTEKIAMMLLFDLIFVVVALNVYHAMKRNVFERMEEIAVLKTMGASGGDLRAIFVLDGLLIGLVGAAAGTLLGILVAINVNGLARAVQKISTVISSVPRLISGKGTWDAGDFSAASFYFTDIPVRLYVGELIFVFLSGLASAAIAAFLASARVPTYRPAEVLRNE